MESPPQSSPTLQDYISCHSRPDISLYQQQQSSSSCIDCQKIIKNHSSSLSSSENQDQLIQPLHRHISEHNKQIQSTIFNLQSQISKLKKENSAKDIVIGQLKRELQDLHTSKILIKKQDEDMFEEKQCQRRQKQVQKIRNQLTYPRPEQKIKHPKQIELSLKDDQDIESSSGDRVRHQNHSRDFVKSKIWNDSIQGYLHKIKKLESHIECLEQEMSWMSNFIISFLTMTETITNMFNQPVIKKNWTLRKKTKIAWRYIKHILGWFVKQS